MKRNDILILISLVLYSVLFYEQYAGVNFLIYSFILPLFLLLRNNTLLKDPKWMLLAAGSIASGIAIFITNTYLAIVANITSLSLLSVFSVSPKSSVFMATIYSIMSYTTSFVYIILDSIERNGKPKEKSTRGSNFWTKLLVYSTIIVVVLIFFFLYRESNALFKDFTKNINLDFISWKWIGFMIIGFLLLYGFFISRKFPKAYENECNANDNLNQELIMNKESMLFGKSFGIHAEFVSGMVLLGLLNIMILVVNVLDINYLWSESKLPEGLTFAKMVHQSIGNLIFSIIIAITIILFYFRNKLNFYKNSNQLKVLTYVWIVQNVFMIISTMYRNSLYVQEFSLTHKRIGVYFYLLLAAIGLIITLWKIAGRKSNWFLFRKNGWAFYAVLIAGAFFNWDNIITNYNLKHSKTVDKYYLLSLSYANIPELLNLPQDKKEFEKDYFSYSGNYRNSWVFDYNSSIPSNFVPKLHLKLYRFLKKNADLSWQSWNMNKHNTLVEIEQLSNKGIIDSLFLKNNYLEEIKPITYLPNIVYLDISNNQITDINEISKLQHLKTLYCQQNAIDSIGKLGKISTLEYLDISNNQLSNLSELSNFENLKTLNLSYNYIDITTLPENLRIEDLNLSACNILDYSRLGVLKQLKTLRVAAMTNRNISTIPYLSSLEMIDLSSNSIQNIDAPLFYKLSMFKGLKSIDLSNNSINNLLLLTEDFEDVNSYSSYQSEKNYEPLFHELEKLNLSQNGIYNTYYLKRYTSLVDLDLSSNQIEDLKGLTEMAHLKTLNLSLNKIRNLEAIEELSTIVSLYLSNNELKNITSLLKLNKLEILDVSNNQITDITNIGNLKNLKELRLNHNAITNIKALESLTKLKSLDISNNPISDYSPLFKLKGLSTLICHDLPNSEFEKLKQELPNTVIIRYDSASYIEQ